MRASIERSGINEKYLPGFEAPGLHVTMDLGEALEGAEWSLCPCPPTWCWKWWIGPCPCWRMARFCWTSPRVWRLGAAGLGSHRRAAGRRRMRQSPGGDDWPHHRPGTGRRRTDHHSGGYRRMPPWHAAWPPTFHLKLPHSLRPMILWAWSFGAPSRTSSPWLAGSATGWPRWAAWAETNLKAAVFTAGFREGCRLLAALGAQPKRP